LINGYIKHIHGEEINGIIPEKIRLRKDKIGFSLPERQLLKNALPYIEAIIMDIPLISNIYNTRYIRNLYLEMLKREDTYSPLLWRVINSIIWQQLFIKSIS